MQLTQVRIETGRGNRRRKTTCKNMDEALTRVQILSLVNQGQLQFMSDMIGLALVAAFTTKLDKVFKDLR